MTLERVFAFEKVWSSSRSFQLGTFQRGGTQIICAKWFCENHSDSFCQNVFGSERGKMDQWKSYRISIGILRIQFWGNPTENSNWQFQFTLSTLPTSPNQPDDQLPKAMTHCPEALLIEKRNLLVRKLFLEKHSRRAQVDDVFMTEILW